MVQLKVNPPEEFLKEEVRNDYTVTEKMKKVWAVEIDLLKELERVCEKYGLTYYADSGTLIGAIRHKGFIPWDDDIDLVMFREDYKKLCRVAAKEFRDPYFFQNVYTDDGYMRGHAQLRRSDTTGCVELDLGQKYNRGLFIDIFILDNVPDSPRERKFFGKRLESMWRVLFTWRFYDTIEKHSLPGKMVGKVIKSYFAKHDPKEYFRGYEHTCQKYNGEETENVSYVEYSWCREKHIWKRSWFDQVKKVPFEYTDIWVPAGYDGRLTTEYGDYMVMSHAPNSHGSDSILEPEIPYKEYFHEN